MQCILEISLKKIKSNWKEINKYSNFRASAVVKANAYGFGLEEIALAFTTADALKFEYLLIFSQLDLIFFRDISKIHCIFNNL